MRNIKTIVMMIMAVLLLSLPASAKTVLYYNCDTDMDGNPGTAGEQINTGTAAAEGVPDLSGNGYNMWGWAATSYNNSPAYSAEGESPNGEGFSVDFTGGSLDGYTSDSTINAWMPETWTIETAVKFTDVDDWYTMIGRNGSQDGGYTADFYFQKNDDNDQFRINFLSVGGTRYILDSGEDFVAEIDTWYRVAVVSDGTTLSMYVDDGSGYQFADSLEMDGTPAENAPVGSTLVWTFGRGWYNGNTNYVPGYMDDIRFSDVALSPDVLLGSVLPPYDMVPEPEKTDGSVGDLSGDDVEVELTFKASPDPNGYFTYDPGVLTHYIYYTKSAADANFIDTPIQIDQTTSDPNVSYLATLEQGVTYQWYVEEGMDNGTGTACAPGDPNNIIGPVWSFVTFAATPTLTGPGDIVTDESGNATWTVESATAETYQWFDAETDTELTEGGLFTGTTTATLTVTGATLDDEGEYYCIGYYGVTPSEKATGRLMTRRLAGWWKFDGDMTDSVASEVSGATGHDGTITDSGNENGTAPGDPNYVGDGNGISGNAMAFSGDNDYVTIADADFFNFFRAGFTFNLWYQHNTDTSWRLPMSKLDAGSGGWLFGVDSNDYYAFIIESPWTGVYGDGDVVVGDGDWHMLTVTYDPEDTTIRLYTDAIENSTQVLDMSSITLPEAPLSIGGRDTELSIDGAIDEVQIYTYPLSELKIATMYTELRPDEYICVIPEGSTLETYDLNDDCRVNLEDLAILSTQWLECQRVPDEACDWSQD